MKRIFTIIIAAILLAAPTSSAITGGMGQSSLQDKKVKKTETVVFNVNMHCESCVGKLTENLSFLKGVEDLKISLDEKRVTITYTPAKTDEATLAKAIEKCGYTAEKVPAEKAKK